MQKKSVTKTLLIIMTLFFWFAQFVYIPYHTPYLLSLGAASSFVGLIVGAYGFAQVLLRVPIGVLADKHVGQKKLILTGLLCAAAASAIRIAFPVPAAFLAANFLSGMTSATWVSVTVFFSSLFDKGELKKATGISIACNNAGILMGFTVSAFVNETLGIPFLFAASIAAAVCGALTLLFVREYPRQDGGRVDVAAVFKNPALLFYSFLGIVLQAVVFSTAMSFTTSYAQQFASADYEIAVGMIVFISVSVASSLMIGYLKRLSHRTLFVFLLGCLVVYGACLPFCTAMWQLYALQAVCGIANGALMSLAMACAMENAPAHSRTTTMAVFQACYGVGMTLGPVLMGVLVDGFGYAAGFWSMAALSAAAIAAVLVKIKGNAFASRKPTRP